jgi:glycogen synthase
MRLFAALGPGDIVGAHRARLSGEDIKETSLAYSEQLLDYCKAAQIPTYAVSQHPRADSLQDGLLQIENRPKPSWGRGGLGYHLAMLLVAVRLAVRARTFRADVALIDSGTTHYFALAVFRLLGVRVAVNLHNVLWPQGFEPTGRLQNFIRRLNAWFFQHLASGAIGVSPECERQVLREARDRIPFFQYRCQFSLRGFRPSSPYDGGPFRIVCAARIERNKGVLDIPEISKGLRSSLDTPVVFHVCGNGPALEALRDKVAADGLRDTVIVHGRLEREALLNLYANSHAVIVPTRSTFTEGMPQVCAEAVLCGLPVITSSVANAFDVLGPAVVQATVDDTESYVKAISKIVSDRACYERHRSSCSSCTGQFTDRGQGYAAAAERLFLRLGLTEKITNLRPGTRQPIEGAAR